MTKCANDNKMTRPRPGGGGRASSAPSKSTSASVGSFCDLTSHIEFTCALHALPTNYIYLLIMMTCLLCCANAAVPPGPLQVVRKQASSSLPASPCYLSSGLGQPVSYQWLQASLEWRVVRCNSRHFPCIPHGWPCLFSFCSVNRTKTLSYKSFSEISDELANLYVTSTHVCDQNNWFLHFFAYYS